MSLHVKQSAINNCLASVECCRATGESEEDGGDYGREVQRQRHGSLWHESSRSVMTTWQKEGESRSVLPLLCLKIWHMRSQQQQWCNLVTSLWHVYSRPKPGSYLPYQQLYIQRGRSPCFLNDCKGVGQKGRGGNFAHLPFSQRQTLTFSKPGGKGLRGLLLKTLDPK